MRRSGFTEIQRESSRCCASFLSRMPPFDEPIEHAAVFRQPVVEAADAVLDLDGHLGSGRLQPVENRELLRGAPDRPGSPHEVDASISAAV